MAQPLARSNETLASGIDAAGASLERAFAHLEAAVAHVNARHHSLKETQEKLNLLLQDAEEKSTHLKQMTGTVLKRLSHTIDKLEKMEA